MAEDLTKEILPIEEQQKQEKNLLYKNWKLYATALGVITVGLAVGLGVGLGVHNSSQNTVSTTQKIVNEINNIRDYALPTINSDATLESITSQITGDFIKTKLTGDNANQFKTEAFTFNKITVGEDNHDLTTSDLVTDGSIAAKINYDYDTIINQTTSLTLTIKSNSQEIVTAINSTTYQLTTITAGDLATDVTAKINGTFIKSSLSNDLQNLFITDAFVLNSITINGNLLSNDDLSNPSTIDAKINYNYGTSNNQMTSLTMTINPNNQEIVTAINSATYTINAYVGDTSQNITNQITGDFIKKQLTSTIATAFETNSFTFKTITISDNTLTDSDLTAAQTLDAVINYQYGGKDKIAGQTKLTIKTEFLDGTTIDETLSKLKYEVSPSLGSSISDIWKDNNGNTISFQNFIALQLSKTSTAIATGFKSGKFSLNSITVGEDHHQLVATDLGKLRTLDAKINYTFNSIEHSSDLTINVTLALPVNIGSLVNDTNKHFTLNGVTTASSDDEIKTAILNQVLEITKDVLGDMWDTLGGLIEQALGSYTIITLDENNPHQGATVAASADASGFVNGSADITFELAQA